MQSTELSSSNLAIILDKLLASLQETTQSDQLFIHDVFLPATMINPIFLSFLNANRAGGDQRESLLSPFDLNFIKDKWKNILLRFSSTLPSRNIDILFWPREETHIDQLLPVIKKTQAEKKNYAVLATTLRAKAALKSRGIRYFDASSIINLNASDSKSTIEKMTHIIKSWQPPLLTEGGKFEIIFKNKLQDLLQMGFINIQIAAAVIQDLKPKFVFVGNDLSPEGRAAVLIAKKYNIPSASIQHGNVFNELSNRHIVDKFFVYGSQSFDYLSDRGLNPSQLAVVGAPYWETCVSKPRDTRALRKTYNLDSGRDIVLIATSGPGHQISYAHHYEIVDSLYELSAQFKNLEFVCKLHRKDLPKIYAEMKIKHPRSRVKVIHHDSKNNSAIHDLISLSRIIITGGSTTAIEGLAMNKTILTLDYRNETAGTVFIEEGLTLHCTTKEQLRSLLHQFPHVKLPCPNKIENFIAGQFGPRDGLVSKRILDSVDQHIGRLVRC